MDPDFDFEGLLAGVPRHLVTQACRLVEVDESVFRFCAETGRLDPTVRSQRARRFTYTRKAQQSLGLQGDRQGIRQMIERVQPRAELVLPIALILAGNDDAYACYFPHLLGSWKGGPVERLVKLDVSRDEDAAAAFSWIGGGLLDRSCRTLADKMRLSWDGSDPAERMLFRDVYNQLRFCAVFTPEATLEQLSGVRSSVRPEQFWLRRALDRALHLTGNLDPLRSWMKELIGMADFDAAAPRDSIQTAAYIGLYFADRLRDTEWSGMQSPDGLEWAWKTSTVAAVIKEASINLSEQDWYSKDKYRNAVNLARLALFLRCHPDQGTLRHLLRQDRQLWHTLRCIAGRSENLGLPRAAHNALAQVRDYMG